MSESPSQDPAPSQAEATPHAVPDAPQPTPQAAPIPTYPFLSQIAQKALEPQGEHRADLDQG